MLNLILLNPILINLLSNQIFIMGNYAKEFRPMENRLNFILKIFLIILFMISIVHMSESNVEEVTESETLIETENLQSSEEKTEEPGKIISQISYFQGTERSAIEQPEEIIPSSLSESNSNNLISFIPNLNSASDDDDSEQNDIRDSYLIAGNHLF